MTRPPDWPRGRPGAHTPAARPAMPYRPGDVVRDLVTLLRGHGLARLAGDVGREPWHQETFKDFGDGRRNSMSGR
ncbi:MAG TPA: hypothetical protein VGM53_01560 [Streptosporangiaceae bacterium]